MRERIPLGELKGSITDELNRNFFKQIRGKDLFLKDSIVLDVGCGDMRVKSLMPECKYVGLDKYRYNNKPMIDSCVSNIPLADNVADVVLSLGFSFWQIEGGLEEVSRVLKNRGALVLRYSQFFETMDNPATILSEKGFYKNFEVQFDYKINRGAGDTERLSSIYLVMNKGDK